MAITIATSARDLIRAAVAKAGAAEACGLLFGTSDHIASAIETANVADNRMRRFEIDPHALIVAHRAARDGGPRVAGCWHSHPEGLAAPSDCDRASAAGDGSVWLIVAGDVMTAWRTTPDGFQSLRLSDGHAKGDAMTGSLPA